MSPRQRGYQGIHRSTTLESDRKVAAKRAVIWAVGQVSCEYVESKAPTFG